jgi:DNA-binding CsgD family transcriptional regulator
MAREAVDVGGMGVLVVDTRGRLAWRSPQAQRWLAEFFPQADDAACIGWLEPQAEAELERTAPDGRALLARRLGTVGLGETMWLLRLRGAGETAPSRLATASLTPRETEVLSWIAKGKTNRDVAEILGMSPRTVNKHLEHVFEKLGVETRAAAAALASRELG